MVPAAYLFQVYGSTLEGGPTQATNCMFATEAAYLKNENNNAAEPSAKKSSMTGG